MCCLKTACQEIGPTEADKGCKFESELSNIELMSAEADKGCKFESELSNIELMSAKADKECKDGF